MKKIIVLFILLLITGCSNKDYNQFNMFFMDTYINIKIYDLKFEDKDKVYNEIYDIYSVYDALCDRYTDYIGVNNVYYLNNVLEDGQSVVIDDRLAEVIAYGLDAYYLTSGKVNIAMGNVLDLWKKYRDSGEGIPSEEEFKNLKSISIFDIILNDNVYTKYNNVKLDLGSYAKGYVTELVADKLEEMGYYSYLINSGGNVKVGNHYSDDKYKIGIENPNEDYLVYKIVSANNTSVVTSGGYKRYYIYDDVKYHHIIDPVTLYPSNFSLGVSVITENSAYADILSTYLFLLPIEEGIYFVNSNDLVEALWYGIDDKVYLSEGYDKYE
ncbi:MAG: FAD:protein FMN transferase [Bacilli bacterium]|nr:FAD:protein FMN transferase [Bacilli bacterium]